MTPVETFFLLDGILIGLLVVAFCVGVYLGDEID